MAKITWYDDVGNDFGTFEIEADTLEELIRQSREAISRADRLIGLLHTQYGLDTPVKVEAAD